MATKYYAWGPISSGWEKDKEGNRLKRRLTKAGTVVSASSLGLTDDQFEELVESRAVRTLPYPPLPDNWTGSPIDWYREQARLAAEAADDPSMAIVAMLAPPDEDEDDDEDEVS